MARRKSLNSVSICANPIKAPVLCVKGLRVEREEKRILKGINWRVESGMHWVILGANGSGKTSLLRAVTGYLTPSAGSIHVLGEEFGRSDWRELRRRIGIVSSGISQMMHGEDCVLDIVLGGAQAEIGIWHKASPEEHRRAGRLLGKLGIRALARRRWALLSQGERQRVLIARALMPDPPVLFLDEPCAGLDPVARERFLADLESLGRVGNAPSLILVTHHIEEIMPVFTHVLGIRGGRSVFCGPKKLGLTSEVVSTIFGSDFEVVEKEGVFVAEC